MAKYFGTDGIRGVYGGNLTDALAFKTGMALAKYFGAGEYIVVRDTRVSGGALEDALIKGLYVYGGSVLSGGILPTPACSYLTKKHKAHCGIVISASHNPPEYNGIKIFDANGLKPDERTESEIENLIDTLSVSGEGAAGKYKILKDAKESYISHLIAESGIAALRGLSIALDCAWGAAAHVAKEVFTKLGAAVTAFNDEYDGAKINDGSGALHPEFLKNNIGAADIGFAFDGDGDRLIIVRDGEILDGDTILYNLANGIPLNKNAVAGTVLSNLALEKQLQKEGKTFYRTPVGDKYIANLLYKENLSLGGEQSGHFIINRSSLTGDAILAALYFIRPLFKNGALAPHKTLTLFPQTHLTLPADKSIMNDPALISLKEKSEKTMGASGRIIIRMSGTEPAVRVMVEGEDAALIKNISDEFRELIAGIGK